MYKKDKKEEKPVAAAPKVPEAVVGEEGGEPATNACCAPLLEQLTASQAEAQENRDHYLRARADLENYRKRAQREKEDLAKFANEAILKELLPVIDNLERALQHAGSEGEGALLQGVELTLGQFRKVLEKFGVAAIEALGAPFDPAHHEALGQIESSEHPANTVVQSLQTGYLLNDRLLRPALVLIAKPPAA